MPIPRKICFIARPVSVVRPSLVTKKLRGVLYHLVHFIAQHGINTLPLKFSVSKDGLTANTGLSIEIPLCEIGILLTPQIKFRAHLTITTLPLIVTRFNYIAKNNNFLKYTEQLKKVILIKMEQDISTSIRDTKNLKRNF